MNPEATFTVAENETLRFYKPEPGMVAVLVLGPDGPAFSDSLAERWNALFPGMELVVLPHDWGLGFVDSPDGV